MTDYLSHATTATGVPIAECDVCGQRHPAGGEHETAPTGEFAPHQPGPGRDSTPSRGRGNRG